MRSHLIPAMLFKRRHPQHLGLFLFRFAVLVLALSLIAPSAQAQTASQTASEGGNTAGLSAAPNAWVTATDIVNIRICASPDCDVIATASLGDPLTVIGAPVNGFLPVEYEGQRGFVYSLFVTDSTEDTWFTQGESGCQRVALIFNIGVGYTPSPSVIDTLVSNDVNATMFPMGNWASAQPDYLRQLVAAGFPIGTHGDQSVLLTGLSDDAIAADITASLANIESVIGQPPILWATPYAADTDPRVRRITAELGLVPVGWTVTANDYDETATEDAVYQRVTENVTDGAIVEFHLDGPATETSTALALPRIIETLRAEGYTFVTVPEMSTPCNPSF